MPAEHLEDAAGRDLEPTPHRLCELEGDPPRTQPRLSEREGDDALLEPRRQLIGHARWAAFARPQHLQPLAFDLALQPVIARAVIPQFSTGAADTNLAGPRKQVHAQPEEQVIIGHRRLLLRTLNTPRMGRFSMPGNPSQVSPYLGSCAA